MESELLSIFRVKVVAQNILLWSLETPCQAAFTLCFFVKKQTVIQNASLIYVKEK